MNGIIKMLSNTKWILIDLDDTIYDYEYSNRLAYQKTYDFLSKKLKINWEIVKNSIKKWREITHKQLTNQWASHSRLLYFQTAIEMLTWKTHLKITLEAYDIFNKTFQENMRLFDDFKKFIEILKEKNIMIWVVTNLTTKVQMDKLIRLWLDEDINYLITSEEAWVEKPDYKIFQIWLDKLWIDKDEICVIWDWYTADCIWAYNFGIRKIYFKINESSNLNDYEIDKYWIIPFRNYKYLIDKYIIWN